MDTQKSRKISNNSVAQPEADQQWRDWAALPSELVEDVANCLLEKDVADLVCFRVVCKAWKNTVKLEPSALAAYIDHRFHPRRWIMLPGPNDGNTRRMFLNIVTKKIIKIDLPALGNHAVVAGSAAAPEGVLVLRDEASLAEANPIRPGGGRPGRGPRAAANTWRRGGDALAGEPRGGRASGSPAGRSPPGSHMISFRILNPLTGHIIDLPSVKTLQRGRRRRRGPVSSKFREDHKVTAAGFAGDSNVVIYFGEVNRMAVAKPGDARWTPVRGLQSPVLTTITFQRRFYCIDHQNLLVLDMAGVLPRLVVAVALNRRLYCVNMLDNRGKIMVLCRRLPVFFYRSEILVYKVNLEEGTVVPLRHLAGQAVFAGDLGAVLLPSPRHWSCIRPNYVYFKYDPSEMCFGWHRMGTQYPEYRDVMGTLANYLAMYVTSANCVFEPSSSDSES